MNLTDHPNVLVHEGQVRVPGCISAPTFPAGITHIALVKEVLRSSMQTRIVLRDETCVKLPAFVYVRAGDALEIHRDGDKILNVHKHVAFGPAESPLKVQLYPPYRVTERIELPPYGLTLVFRERYGKKDWQAAKILEQFHYRGQGLNRIVGRRTVVLADADGIGVIGYGVLSATVAAAKPRFELFETNFTEQMRSKLINKIARIPRVVVHPDFRGLGIATRLVKHLVNYATTRWDINSYKPIMVEVIASMTDYHRFFQMAGFIDIGQTLGYDKPIIPKYGKGTWQARPNAGNYHFFGAQGSKPYLVYPLCREVSDLIARKHTFQRTPTKVLGTLPLLKEPIRFRNVSVCYQARNGLSERASVIKGVFGVDATQMYSHILRRFSLTIEPGDVVLITGASGSGKSTLIKLLTHKPAQLADVMVVEGYLHRPNETGIACLMSEWNEKALLVDQVGETLRDAISILNGVGLAEAHLYLKTPAQISDGQRYRFALARLCNSGKPVWVDDEFASTLDSLTAAVVAKGLRKLAVQHGATVILAAPHVGHFVSSLAPTQLVQLRWGGHATIHSLKLRYRSEGDGVSFWVTNRARSSLTDMNLMLTDIEGRVRLLSGPVGLSGLARTTEIKLPWSEIRGCVTLRAASREGAGDVLYLEATSPASALLGGTTSGNVF